MLRLFSLLIRLLGCITLFGGLIIVGLLLSAGYWLPVQEDPKPADAIVVLGGSFTRPIYAADLYLQGLAPKVLISNTFRPLDERKLDEIGVPYPREVDVYKEVLEKLGVPSDVISPFGPGNMSTAQEGKELRALFAGDPKSLLVVTSPYHVRRTRMILEDQLPGMQVQVVGTPYDPFEKHWWNNRENALQLVTETTKFIFYMAGGRFFYRKEPL